jgi:hypothetical protein
MLHPQAVPMAGPKLNFSRRVICRENRWYDNAQRLNMIFNISRRQNGMERLPSGVRDIAGNAWAGREGDQSFSA